MSKRRLGKGIDALLQGRDLEQLSSMTTVLQVPIDKLTPNPNQPRTRFNEATLAELAASINEKGIIQPIIAEDQGDGSYIIVAGERRYRAAKIAGLDELPVIPQDFSEEEKLEIALVENLQREDLNPIEEARAFQNAMKDGGYTQDQLAKRLGKSRSAVANTVRLLNLDKAQRDAISAGTITAGHARALLAIENKKERLKLFEQILSDGLSVREAESASRPADERLNKESPGSLAPGTLDPSISEPDDVLELPPTAAPVPGAEPGREQPKKSPEIQRLEDKLVTALGTKVLIKGHEKSGRIEITYYSPDDLDRLIETLGISLD